MKKKLKVLLLVLVLCILANTIQAQASVPYKTLTVDGYGDLTETQTAYTPYDSITKVGDIPFQTPVDMVISSDGLLYIADSGAKKIIVSDLEGNDRGTIGEGILVTPTGVFVKEEQDKKIIYVADKGAKKVFLFSEDGELLQEYGKPSSPIYGDQLDFKPMKLVVNDGGSMYIICEGNTNGIVQISPAEGGSFLGYFGTNLTSLSPFEIMQRMILTDAQIAKMLANIPSTPTNLTIDKDGLIYTVSQGKATQRLKKLNIAGNNMIEPDICDLLPAAVTTGNYENIFVAANDGYIYEYSSEGDLLFVFGGRDDGRFRIGLCSKVEAIAVDSNDHLYVLDSEKKQIHIFEPTEFTNLLHESLYLYSKGRYTESKEPLTKVLQMNSLFDYANQAMGRAYLQEENYSQSLKYAKLSKDWNGYSDAFWEVRNIWIRSNLVQSVGILLLVIAVILILKRLHKKRQIFAPVGKVFKPFTEKTLVQQLKYTAYFIRHPLDGCYGVRRENKASMLCANILIGLFILISIINKYFCGFLFTTVREGYYDLVSDIGIVIIVFVMLTACNYLVVTINDGESKFKQLYCGFAYCLTPYLFIKPFSILISNVITYNEMFLIQFIDLFIQAWMVILIFLAIKELNNYSIRDTIKVIVLTAFTVLIAALLLFIVYVLCTQVADFISTIGREVGYRFGN